MLTAAHNEPPIILSTPVAASGALADRDVRRCPCAPRAKPSGAGSRSRFAWALLKGCGGAMAYSARKDGPPAGVTQDARLGTDAGGVVGVLDSVMPPNPVALRPTAGLRRGAAALGAVLGKCRDVKTDASGPAPTVARRSWRAGPRARAIEPNEMRHRCAFVAGVWVFANRRRDAATTGTPAAPSGNPRAGRQDSAQESQV